MLFNSIVFGLFLPLVFGVYWSLRPQLRAQNALLIVAGCVFYGWWDWRFLLLLLATSLTDYLVALGMGRTERAPSRKVLLAISLVGNLGTLAVFKYYDFFAASLAALLHRFGWHVEPTLLHVVLPVGISFYTFQALSYTIDVYRGRIQPVKDPLAFLAFISFFPQLCAGPIERASHMLPQFMRPRTFDAALASDGVRQMLWGFFKKVVIADNCAPLVNEAFANADGQHPVNLLYAAFLFAFQIYCDFGGYSDIAIGCARLFGFDLMRNFAFPYFSRDIAEFWRRWHMSLTSWFRDYVYIPLGGSRGSRWVTVRNTFVVFLVSGLWHGANWTFIAWGALHALLFVPLLLRGANRTHMGTVAEGRLLPSLKETAHMLLTFAVVMLAWVFFRAASVQDAFSFLKNMVVGPWRAPFLLKDSWLFGVIGLLLLAEWLQRERQHALEVGHLPAWMRRSVYVLVFLCIFFLGRFEHTEFIYFQF
jgi:D-alanyl-lipoteichoic acid acyltransferase DltB (MBOAT superfamily)